LLPLLQVAWANLQGLWAFGPVLIAAFGVESLLRRDRRGMFAPLLKVGVVTLLAAAVSPYHIHNLLFPLELARKVRPGENLYSDSIAELASIRHMIEKQQGLENIYVWIWFGVLGLGWLIQLAALVRLPLGTAAARLLLLGAFSLVGYGANRNWNHFAQMVAILSCWNLADLLRRSNSAGPSTSPVAGDSLEDRLGIRVSGAIRLGAVFALGSALTMLISGRWFVMTGSERTFGFGFAKGFNAPEAMKVAGQPGMPKRAALLNWGHAGEYIHANGPERQVYFDGRLETHSVEGYKRSQQFEESLKAGPGETVPFSWDAELRALDCGTLMIDGQFNFSAQATALAHPGWLMIHWDPVLAVFVDRRQAPPGSAPVDFRARWPEGRAPFEDLPEIGPVHSGPWNAFRDWPSEDERLAERLFNLVQATDARPGAVDPVQRGAMLLHALRSAHVAVRQRPWRGSNWRVAGSIWLSLRGTVHPQVTPIAPRVGDNPVSAVPAERSLAGGPAVSSRWLGHVMAASLLRQAIRQDPRENSARIYLATLLSEAGLIDEPLALLESIRTLRPRNAAQIRARAMIVEPEIRRLTADVQAARVGLGTSVDAVALARAGLVRAALSAAPTHPEATRWKLLLGEPVGATLAEGSDELVTLARFASGQFREGAPLGNDPKGTAESAYAWAWRKALAGDARGMSALLRSIDSRPGGNDDGLRVARDALAALALPEPAAKSGGVAEQHPDVEPDQRPDQHEKLEQPPQAPDQPDDRRRPEAGEGLAAHPLPIADPPNHPAPREQEEPADRQREGNEIVNDGQTGERDRRHSGLMEGVRGPGFRTRGTTPATLYPRSPFDTRGAAR
jgi:hypothetical protein